MKTHEWQLTNLELSKCIKELGVKQESLWYWSQYSNWRKQQVGKEFYLVFKPMALEPMVREAISAFTVAELYQIIYDKGLSFGLPDRLKPEVIPTYMASFLIMALKEKEHNLIQK